MDSGMMRQVFDALDSNQDGFLSPEEIMDFLSRLGVEFSPDRMNHLLLLSSSHVNPAHGLLFQDFLAFYHDEDKTGMASHDAADKEEEKNENGEEEELLAAFAIIDRDGDGLISGTDLRDFLIQTNLKVGVSLQDCEQMIKRVDEDGNGHIDFLEFKQMMSSGSNTLV